MHVGVSVGARKFTKAHTGMHPSTLLVAPQPWFASFHTEDWKDSS